MSLKELNDKLHGRDVHLDRTRNYTSFDPDRPDVGGQAAEAFKKSDQWSQQSVASSEIILQDLSLERARQKKIRIWLSLAGAVVAIVAIVGIYTLFFNESRVTFSISGPKNVASAESITYTFDYSNRNLATLKNVSVVVSFPETFHPESNDQVAISGSQATIPIGTVGWNGKGSVTLSGKFYGSKGDVGYFSAALRYIHGGTASEISSQYGVNVASSPLSIEITSPLELSSGQEMVYEVDYANTGDLAFSNVRTQMDYPDGFTFVSSEPSPSEGDSVWYLGTLPGGTIGKIVIRGVLSGTDGVSKTVGGKIGFFEDASSVFIPYGQNERQTKIVASPLTIAQTVNGSTSLTAKPGEMLRYSIVYRNNGNTSLRDAVITIALDSDQLDYSQLSLFQSGAYDPASKTITWKASDVPALSRLDPGAQGELVFSVPIYDTVVIGENERNLSIRSVAKIDSPDVPRTTGSNKIIGSDTLFVKIAAGVKVSLVGAYADTTFSNSGSLPPVVGSETTYTMRVRIDGSSNDAIGSRAVVALPTGVSFKGKVLPESESTTWNERTHELSWEVGTLLAGSKNREIAFQVGITPNVSQVGKEATLINQVTFTGKDSFTNDDITVVSPSKTTYFQEDQSVRDNGGQIKSAQ